jgi:hypothetical protein
VSLPGHDEGAQRTLERQALLNVQSLAGRLANQDGIDRRVEKWGVRFVVGSVGVILLVMGVFFVLRAPPADEEARKRCVFDTQAVASFRYRERMRAENPKMSERTLDALAYDQYESLEPHAQKECAAKFGAE